MAIKREALEQGEEKFEEFLKRRKMIQEAYVKQETMGIKRKAPEAEEPADNKPEMKRSKLMIREEEAELDVEPGSMSVELMRHQKQALAWMLAMEKSTTRGGILADDQGLGKTISTIALILTAGARSPSPSEQAGAKPSDSQGEESNPEPEDPKKPGGGTLIVCPLSVLRQWEREIAAKVSPSHCLSTLVYHGDSRKGTPETLASYDVVITTYGVVTKDVPFMAEEVTVDDSGPSTEQLSAMRRRLEKMKMLGEKPGPLAKVSWHRVVLDEAQNIRNAYTQVSLACRDLSSRFRWGLSGTPLQNKLDDLYAFFRFLRVPPHDTCWGFRAPREVLKEAFQRIVLRRSKSSVIDGKPVLELPKRVVNRVSVEFTGKEKEMYEDLRKKFLERIEEYKEDGKLHRKRFIVLCMLLRLRQMCDHPGLLVRKSMFPDEEDRYLRSRGFDEMDPEDKHRIERLEQEMREMLSRKQLEFQQEAEEVGRSSKVKAVMEVLAVTPPGEKTLVFSQWASMLGIMEPELNQAGIRFTRIDGSMSTSGRDAAIKRFSEDPGVSVMLLSLKAAGCGLNLVAASRVVLLDMWWNPTSEDQAIDRAHRIGQTKAVQVTKFIVEHSVEESILKTQKKKKDMVEFAFGEKMLDENSLSMDELVALFQT